MVASHPASLLSRFDPHCALHTSLTFSLFPSSSLLKVAISMFVPSYITLFDDFATCFLNGLILGSAKTDRSGLNEVSERDF